VLIFDWMVYGDEQYSKPPPHCALPHHSHHNTFYAQTADIQTDLKNRTGGYALNFLAVPNLL
jgi:hypothetical protein